LRISGGVAPGGNLLEQRLRDRGDLGVGGADIDVGLEEDLDDAEAVIGIGDDVLDVVDRGRQRALNGVVMRPAIWSGGRPVYCQTTPITGCGCPERCRSACAAL
jgi:hypothetical protein